MTGHEVSDYVAEKIREARKARGWTTDELAERCSLTGNIIENIESGRRRNGERTRDVTIDELFEISKALGVGPLKLLPARQRTDIAVQDRAIANMMNELRRDSEILSEITGEIERAQQRRRELEDRIEKNTWLMEQMRAARD